YHFTHIDNAVKIIREKKVKSRNTANQLSDSAGNVVYTRADAHKYARFYFRPHTQTQFYNEYLGTDINMGYNRDGEWHSWYEREYRMLDFPKCPKPIYFEFSLQDILFKMFEKCNISTGNMQRKRTKFGRIPQMMHLFNIEDLFINPGMDSEDWRKFREFAQQEFMIEDELDFSTLECKIICATTEDKDLLKSLLGKDSNTIGYKIFVDNSYYRTENPAVHCEQSESQLTISTKKQAEGYFVLSSNDINQIEVIEGNIIKKQTNKLFFKSCLQINNNLNSKIRISYIDEIEQEWLVFANYELQMKEYEDIKIKTQKVKKERVLSFHNVVF